MIETMVVVAIAAILMAIASPSMRHLIERNGVADSVNSFMGSLAYARAEAIKRGLPVTLCRSTNAETAAPTCSSGIAWTTGWLVFVDLKGDGGFSSTSGDVILRRQGGLEKNGKLEQASKYGSLTFRSTGTLTSIVPGFSFKSSSDISSLARLVCVGVGGRARIVNAPVPDGGCSA